ncbi:hypothetical protein JHK87_056807 [Glycine soja]|nr:hypothetical protein JHK87_056807 [Glycine soja]
MGDSRKKHRRVQDSPSSSSSSCSESDDSSRRRRRRRREKEMLRKSEEKEERRRKKRDRERKKKKKRLHDSDDSCSSEEEDEQPSVQPETVITEMMKEFPNVGNDLKQLLQMIDDGQAVDIKGISEKSLAKHLKKLFLSLNLMENGDRVFLLHSKARPTLDVVFPLIQSYMNMNPMNEQADTSAPVPESSSVPIDTGNKQMVDDHATAAPEDHSVGPRRRMIGPAMPSVELLAAAAKLTEAQTELRDAELDDDTELFVGPPPPALVSEAESANEAERFEEVTRIMEVEADSPYDVLGVNHNMSSDNIKKKYWKMSLLVHPDKCSHPQAHQAFIKLNKAFKELQDPEKRKAMDEKIKLKQEQEQFQAELKTMREAALWRRSQGISMEGDEELLAQTEVKVEPKRDEWMTTLPPERKPGGMTMHSTKFSRGPKEGRGDTSVWTDTPSDRAQKAKMKYKYQEEAASKSKKKSKEVKQQLEKEDWVGQHPWKPWDREKDLTAGRKTVNFDSESMTKNLSSRFSSGNFQRNFL